MTVKNARFSKWTLLKAGRGDSVWEAPYLLGFSPLLKQSLFFPPFIKKKIFRAASVAYGGSQARGQIRALAASLRYSHSNVGSELRVQIYTTAHGNARSRTH